MPGAENMSTEHLRVGTRYRFAGLPGSAADDERLLTVHSISVTGDLCYRLDFQGKTSLGGLPLVEAERLIELGIWERLEAKCRACGGQGWTNEHDPSCMGLNCGDQCPIQVPCQQCRGEGVEMATVSDGDSDDFPF